MTVASLLIKLYFISDLGWVNLLTFIADPFSLSSF